MNNLNELPRETLQRLIDFAHAAMGKRHGYPDEYPVSQSRLPGGYATICVKDCRELQKLGKPSWEQSK